MTLEALECMNGVYRHVFLARQYSKVDLDEGVWSRIFVRRCAETAEQLSAHLRLGLAFFYEEDGGELVDQADHILFIVDT